MKTLLLAAALSASVAVVALTPAFAGEQHRFTRPDESKMPIGCNPDAVPRTGKSLGNCDCISSEPGYCERRAEETNRAEAAIRGASHTPNGRIYAVRVCSVTADSHYDMGCYLLNDPSLPAPDYVKPIIFATEADCLARAFFETREHHLVMPQGSVTLEQTYACVSRLDTSWQ
jgi:hypothetical protein